MIKGGTLWHCLILSIAGGFAYGCGDTDNSSCTGKDLSFSEFVLDHDSCSADGDCAVVGDCGPNADFTAVQSAHSDEAYALMEARCPSAYDGPVFNAKCVDKKCTLEQRTDTCCGCPPNGGP